MSANLENVELKMEKNKTAKVSTQKDLALRDYSDRSFRSENKRYNSTERKNFKFATYSLPRLHKNFSASKYSLSHHSDNLSVESQNENKDVEGSTSIEKSVPEFNLKNQNELKQSNESLEKPLKAEMSEKEKSKFQQKNPSEERKGAKAEVTEEEMKNVIEPEKCEVTPKVDIKGMDPKLKESLDFATFLKNQEIDINQIRDSDLSDVLRIQKHVQDLISGKKDKKDRTSNGTLRQTLDFILSDSDESLDMPDKKELKESIIKFERKSLVKQSEDLLKSMRDAISNAKI